MQIISVKEAKAKGLKHYFTGLPCKYGHICKRYVTGGCIICQREHTRKSYAKHSKKKNLETKEYRIKNREAIRQIQRNYYKRNSEKIRTEQSFIRAQRLKRIPSWFELEKENIDNFYNNCPKGYQVDHIIPLKGKLVSGLHVFTNLQYLTESENKAKNNRINLKEL